MITARLTGKLLFVAGFLLAIYGLGEANQLLVHAGLALVFTGMIATAVGVYQYIKARRADRH